jgi:methyl-accepting chemotaxis protein
MNVRGKNPVQEYQKYMCYSVAAHVPIYIVAALFFSRSVYGPAFLQLILAAIAFCGVLLYKKSRALSLDLSTIAIALTPAVLVYTLEGHAWQLDAHMYFFASLAMVIGFKSIRAAFMASLAIALHHLSLNFILPYAVFPEGADFARVVFHAVIVVVETAVILITIRGLLQNDKTIMAENEVTKAALEDANQAKRMQEKAEKRSEQERKMVMNDIALDFDAKVGGLITSLGIASAELRDTAEVMRGVADKTSTDSESVALSSEEASQNVNTVASAMEEMSASSCEISSQMVSVKNQSADTAQNARSANETVSNLKEQADNIGEVVGSIRDIAEQTNLLALNATIEAARAGDAGKGFAVVADEVKKLASETAKKTEEIGERVSRIQGVTQDSVLAMERIIQNVSEIENSVSGVSAAVEEQNATTNEIVRSISDASQGVERVSKIILDVKSGAENSGASSDNVLTSASGVAQLTENLKKSIDEFLSQIKTDASQDDVVTTNQL